MTKNNLERFRNCLKQSLKASQKPKVKNQKQIKFEEKNRKLKAKRSGKNVKR